MFIKWRNKSSLSESELLRKYQETNDAEYYGELFKRYTYFVAGVCMKYLRDENETKDAVMEIFEKLMTEIIHRDIENLNRWFYIIARNHCLKRIRKEQRIFLNQTKYKFFLDENVESSPIGGHTDGDKEEQLRNLQEALAQLNMEQKQCVELFYLKGKTYEEIEQITGYNGKEVKSFIQNGKRNLKILIEKNNGQQ